MIGTLYAHDLVHSFFDKHLDLGRMRNLPGCLFEFVIALLSGTIGKAYTQYLIASRIPPGRTGFSNNWHIGCHLGPLRGHPGHLGAILVHLGAILVSSRVTESS